MKEAIALSYAEGRKDGALEVTKMYRDKMLELDYCNLTDDEFVEFIKEKFIPKEKE